MADGWARLTDRPGVCLVTAGPGFTNALTAIAAARLAESPVLFLSGGAALSSQGKGGFQEVDQLALARPLCKAAWQAQTPAESADLVARAVRTAQQGTP